MSMTMAAEGWRPILAQRSRLFAAVLASLVGSQVGCGGPAADSSTLEAHAAGTDSWAITAWGERFEIFPEAEPLVAGEATVAHIHLTELDGFVPVPEGSVEVVLAGDGGEQSFSSTPVRPGVFDAEIEPAEPGDYDLLFRITGPSGSEEIRGGRVRVGTQQEPGGLLVAPAPRGATDGGEPVSFLKEEQWRSDFATQWVRRGRLPGSVAGLAKLRPPAGGERVITATVDGVVQPPTGSDRWPFEGMSIERGERLLRLVPQVARAQSLAALEAELEGLDAELAAARSRSSRLEELLALQATSRREVEEAQVRLATLEAKRAAAQQDLRIARAARSGGPMGGGTHLLAPWTGAVAGIEVAPGNTVAAGDALMRVVRTDRLWIEVALAPAAAAQLATHEVGGIVLTNPAGGSVRLEEGVQLISIAPEVSYRTGTVAVLVEAPSGGGLVLGSAMEARILTAETREGVVIPTSAMVDDGGVPVVYLQLDGESFVRQPVQVLERQGDRLLVDSLVPGQRLVSRGGAAIRRSSLMASGEAHGHVH